MTSADPERSSEARAAAELALLRVVGPYGATPEFVLLGGLVPQLLCSVSPYRHAGTTDVDVQVDLEIASGATNAGRLEQALTEAGFTPDDERVWRWQLRTARGHKAEIKFELLADLDTEPQGATVMFDGSQRLGAANLRGTGYASKDAHERTLHAVDADVARSAVILVTGVAGFLMAKVAAAAGRRKPRDWYDIAFVLLHNDAESNGADVVRAPFPNAAADARTWLVDLRANFADLASQGTRAYADQFLLDHPEEDPAQIAADGMLAVTAFCDRLLAVGA